jgi:hypothetical protein
MRRRKRIYGDDQRRFWSKVEKTPTCWIWLGRRDRWGYGLFDLAGRQQQAHRVSLEWATDEKLGFLFACHHCDNPACVRPDHLFAGTHQDNMNDALLKGSMRRDQCPKGHPYSIENTYSYGGKRRCRACYLAWQTTRRAEQAGKAPPAFVLI